MTEEDCYGILYDGNDPDCQRCKIAGACKRKQLGEPEPPPPQPDRSEETRKEEEGEKPKLEQVAAAPAVKVPDPEDPIWKKVRGCLGDWATKSMILEKVPGLEAQVLDKMIYRLAPALERQIKYCIEK